MMSFARWRRAGWWSMLALVPLLVSHPGIRRSHPGGQDPIDPSWMAFDAGTRTVTFKLTAGLTGLNGALNFNGFRDGELTFIVPAGWTVVMDVYNHDGMLPHSAQVAPDQTPVPLRAMDQAAIGRAYTDKVEEGLPPQARDKMRFTAQPAGDYLIICGVPGHARSGMWIRLHVSADGKEPAMVATPKEHIR